MVRQRMSFRNLQTTEAIDILCGYRQELPNHRFIVEYKVIRLVELEGQSVFDTENLGLTPFAPLMKPPAGMEGVEWAIQCDERTKRSRCPPTFGAIFWHRNGSWAV